MSSPFETLLANADNTIDRVFADEEGFAFTPMREVRDAEPVEDEYRDPIASITAVFDDQGLLLMVGNVAGAERSSSGPMISVQERYLPQKAKRLDIFTRLSDGKQYRVTRVDPDGLGRLVLTVTEVV